MQQTVETFAEEMLTSNVHVAISTVGGNTWILNQANKGTTAEQWYEENARTLRADIVDPLRASMPAAEEMLENLKVVSLATLQKEYPDLWQWWLDEAWANESR